MSIIAVNEVNGADLSIVNSREDWLSTFEQGDIIHLLENAFGEVGDSVYVFDKCGASNEINRYARFTIDASDKFRIYNTWGFYPIVGQRIIIQNPSDSNAGLYEVISVVDDAPAIFTSLKALEASSPSTIDIAATQAYISVSIDDYMDDESYVTLDIDVTAGGGAGTYAISDIVENINDALETFGLTLSPTVDLSNVCSLFIDDDGDYRIKFIGIKTSGTARKIKFIAPPYHGSADGTEWILGINSSMYPYIEVPRKSGLVDIEFVDDVDEQTALVVNPKLIPVGSVAAIRDEVRTGFHKDLKKTIYSGADFNTILDEALSFARKEFGTEFNNFVAADLGIMLLDLMAYIFDAFSFNQDFQASETFMDTVQLTSNATIISRGLGYLPHGAIAATGDISISIMTTEEASSPAQSFIIGKGSKIEANGRVFTVASDIHIQGISVVGVATVFAGAVFEGELLTKTQKANGLSNQVVRLEVADNKYLAANTGYTEVAVGGTEYQSLDFLVFDSDKQNAFETSYHANPPTIKFGDGVAGIVPSSGSDIVVNYAVTSGRIGNSSVEGVSSSFGEIIYKDENGNLASSALISIITNSYLIDDILVSFDTIVSGGADPEGLESIKINAPKAFSTAQRAVTSDDFYYFINNYSNGVKGVAVPLMGIEDGGEVDTLIQDYLESPIISKWYEEVFNDSENVQQLREYIASFRNELNSIINESGKVNHVSVYIVSTDESGRYVSPTNDIMIGLENFLNGKKLINTTLSVLDGIEFLIRVNVAIKLRVKDLYIKEDVLADVITVLTSLVVGKNFGDDLLLSDMIDAAKEVDGVKDISINLIPYRLTKLDGYGEWASSNLNILRGPEDWYDILFEYASETTYIILNSEANYGAYEIETDDAGLNEIHGYDTDGFNKTQIVLKQDVRDYVTAVNVDGSFFVTLDENLSSTGKAISASQIESETDVDWTSVLSAGDLFVIKDPENFENSWIYKVDTITYAGSPSISTITIDLNDARFGHPLPNSGETGMSMAKVTWDVNYSALDGTCNADNPNVDEISGDFNWYFEYDDVQENVRVALAGLGNSYIVKPETYSHVIEGEASWFAVYSTKDQNKVWHLEILTGTDGGTSVAGIYRIQLDSSGNSLVSLAVVDAAKGEYNTRVTIDKKWNQNTSVWEDISATNFSASAANLSCNFVMFGEQISFFISRENSSGEHAGLGNVGVYSILAARQSGGQTIFTIGSDLNGYADGVPLTSDMQFKCFLIKQNDTDKDTEGNIIAENISDNKFELITLGEITYEFLTKEI